MRRYVNICLCLLAAVLLLSGCSIRTIEDLYCLPKRSEEYQNLQKLIDGVMVNLEYSAPISGENQQTVQMVDLNGDGEVEYLLFAKGNAEKPLNVFIFGKSGENYLLLDTIECAGTAFEQVEYVQMSDDGSTQLVIGRQLSDQVVRSVSVYTMRDGQIEQLLSTGYSKFVCHDMDGDHREELLILRPGQSDADNGIGELFSLNRGVVERSGEVNMSRPSDQIKRIIVGKLNDGARAVYVASDVDGSAIITDVYAIVDGQFINVSFSNESGTSVQTLRNYYVYADDIDNDGVVELPSMINMRQLESGNAVSNQYLIRWYAMRSDGAEVDKMYTYHNFVGGWYLELGSEYVSRLTVTQLGNSYEFSVWNEDFSQAEKIMTIYALTGQKREEQAQIDNRFVIYRSESTVYAANLEVASGAYGMSQDGLISSFHLILQDWNTGET
ncbi:MAG: hypothetical protein ACI4PO_01885 [Faecousia sp.]